MTSQTVLDNIAKLRAQLPETVAAIEALDVDRLQKALVWCIPMGTEDVLGSPNDLARAIAREYARLGDES